MAKDNPTEFTKKVADESRYVVEWITRILAICILMGLIVWGGMYLDKRWNTRWITPVSVVGGMLFGIAGLLLVVKRMEMIAEPNQVTPRKGSGDCAEDGDDSRMGPQKS